MTTDTNPIPDDPSTKPAQPDQAVAAVKETELPTPGARWKGAYQIEEALAKGSGTPSWLGIHIISMDPVLVRLARTNDAVREKTWARLCKIGHAAMLKPREAFIVGKHRFEVYDANQKQTLREWRAMQPSVDADLFSSFLRVLTGLVGELHDCGIGHFNLRPETLFIDETEAKPRLFVGGLEAATLLSQAEPIAIAVDPFYAPPEAAGQTQHPPGESLAAWDWWSVGRILQELELGRHVLSLLIKKDVSSPTPEIKSQAEALLLQRLSGASKAGAVEAMPELDKRLGLLLRGLLSTNREGRWRRFEIGRWLEGASPKEHYALTAKERCLRFMNEAYTAPELIELLRTEELWEQAPAQLLDGDMPDSLAAFLHENFASTLGAKLDSALTLLTEESLQEFPPEALREATLTTALTLLAGGKMILRGRPVSPESLKEYLGREDGSGQWLASFWALSSAPVIALLEKSDRDAARILGDLGKLANKALEKAWEKEWLSRNDLLAITRMWIFSCESSQVLQKKCEMLHREFACSSRPEVDTVFQPLRPPPEDLVILAYMDSERSRFGFLTHEEFARREYEAFKAQGLQMVRVVFWKRLYEALHTSPWLFGRLRWLLGGWSGLALLAALAFPGPVMTALAFCPLLVAVVVRVSVSISLRTSIATVIDGAKPWRIFDGPLRCQAEIAGHPSAHRSSTELVAQLEDINREIGALTLLKPTPPQIPIPARFAGLGFLGISSWILMALLGLGCLWQMKLHPPSLRQMKQAWGAPSSSLAEEEAAEPVKVVKIAWDFRAPSDIRTLKPADILSATDEQLQEARQIGKSLTDGFIPSTISAPILVRVTTESRFGFMLYDGRRGQVANQKVYILLFNPIPRSWIEMDGRKVYVLSN